MNRVMNGVMNKESGKEKEIPPSPPIGKERPKENSPYPNPYITRAREGSDSVSGSAPAAYGSGSGTVDFRQMKGSGSASRRVTVDAKFILEGDIGDGRRNDPVQMAKYALNIPATSTGENGKTYNNARIMRHYVMLIGERAFRELVYQQWRENVIDGLPHSTVAAFMSKLYTSVYGERHAT